jgi:hypothetical protein
MISEKNDRLAGDRYAQVTLRQASQSGLRKSAVSRRTLEELLVVVAWTRLFDPKCSAARIDDISIGR